MSDIFQLGGPCSLCPLPATLLITCQYFPYEDCSISLVTAYFRFILVASCVYCRGLKLNLLGSRWRQFLGVAGPQ